MRCTTISTKRAVLATFVCQIVLLTAGRVNAFSNVSPRRSNLPPPPSPTSNPSDDGFRKIRHSWPVSLQNWLTESGALRFFIDSLVVVGVPGLFKEYPDSFWDFFHLSTSSTFLIEGGNDSARSIPKTRLTTLQYGDEKSQFIDLFEPVDGDSNGVVVFVHGGSWGSGMPWHYRLCALPFLEQNKAVAIVGYRTFPDADADGQASDISDAIDGLAMERPDLLDDDGDISALICHSSGAHIGLLHVLESSKNVMRGRSLSTRIKRFVGISGVYCISSHFRHEAGRGVDQISPMRVACGPEDKFEEFSPAFRLECIMGDDDIEKCTLVDGEQTPGTLPEFLFIHGVDDETVQYVQTCDMVDSIRSVVSTPERCSEYLLDNVNHSDTAFHLMVGGVTRDILAEKCRHW